jgi:hypothetical protein
MDSNFRLPATVNLVVAPPCAARWHCQINFCGGERSTRRNTRITLRQPHFSIDPPPRLGRSGASSARRDGVEAFARSSQQTRRWREPDSNHRFRLRCSPSGSSLVVSADLSTLPSRKRSSQRTQRWRELDSNLRFRARAGSILDRVQKVLQIRLSANAAPPGRACRPRAAGIVRAKQPRCPLGFRLPEPSRTRRGVRCLGAMVVPDRRVPLVRDRAHPRHGELPARPGRAAGRRQCADLLLLAHGRHRHRSLTLKPDASAKIGLALLISITK